MNPDSVTLGPLQAEDLTAATGLSAALGWPYRPEDWAFAHRLGRGFALKLDGRLVGTAMGWDYGADFATVGMIIVDAALRGLGLGARLVDALIDQAGSRSIVLNATSDGLELYRRRGFVGIGTTCQHQGLLAAAGTEPCEAGLTVSPARDADWQALIALDGKAAGMPRDVLLNALAVQGKAIVLRGRDGALLGYAISRQFGRGHVIGPVVAPDLAAAKTLITEAVKGLEHCFVRVDTPARSGLGSWLERSGLPLVDKVEAMVRGPLPTTTPSARIFALCSQSLG